MSDLGNWTFESGSKPSASIWNVVSHAVALTGVGPLSCGIKRTRLSPAYGSSVPAGLDRHQFPVGR